MCVEHSLFFLEHGKLVERESYYSESVWGMETNGLEEVCTSLSMTQHWDQSLIFEDSGITNCLPIQHGLGKSSNQPTNKIGGI